MRQRQLQDSGLDDQRWQGFRHRWSSGVHLRPVPLHISTWHGWTQSFTSWIQLVGQNMAKSHYYPIFHSSASMNWCQDAAGMSLSIVITKCKPFPWGFILGSSYYVILHQCPTLVGDPPSPPYTLDSVPRKHFWSPLVQPICNCLERSCWVIFMFILQRLRI